ncbi:MAG TPA: hypothetical protein VFQ90_14190 [Stellaceae bacterium]|nr:hypothetical protein [Stellaceae bacterium]
MASGLYLTLLVGPLVPLPAPKPVIDALTSVQVTTSATGRSGFHLVFTLSDRSTLQTLFLLAAGGPAVELRVVIVVTFGGIPQVLMDGVMRHHEVQPVGNTGHSTVDIMGEDLTAVMDLVQFPGLPYPMPVEARVAAILAKYAVYGVIPAIVPSVVPDIPLPVERIPGQQGTDLAYINELARQAGYVFYLDPGPAPGVSTAYWGPQVKFGIPQPALSINMDSWTNVESLSFRYQPNDSTLPIVFTLNQTTHTPIPIPIPPVTPLNPPLGAFVPPPTRVEELQETAKLSLGQALMIGMARASASADVVTGTGSLDVLRYGRVLKSRQLVGVRGAGPAFDGLHYVESVTHRLSRGEYKQDFTLKRNALISNTPVVPTIGI